jgi:hypothetical protein
MYIDPTKTPLIDSKDPRWMVNFKNYIKEINIKFLNFREHIG